MPRIERLKQNTPEWHRWRLQGIGASDAPVVMGDAPFRTRRYLWSVKTGLARESGVGPAARRGRALEYAARIAYERHTGIQMEPLCLVHDGLQWMRASLDGLSFDGAIVLEIKCPWGNRDQAALREGQDSGTLLRPGPAPAGGLRRRRAALLVVRRQSRDAGHGAARSGVRGEAAGDRDRLLVAGARTALAG